WKVSENGATAATVQPTDSYRTLAAVGAPYITLQAQWGAKSYVVHYDTDGGEPASIPSTPATGDGALRWASAVPIPAAPTRLGFTFTGWKLWKIGEDITLTPAQMLANPPVLGATPYSTLALRDGIDWDSI